MDTFSKWYDAIQQEKEAGGELSDVGTYMAYVLESVGYEQQVSAEAAETSADAISDEAEATDTAADSAGTLLDSLANLADTYTSLSSALGEYNSTGTLSLDTLQSLAKLFPDMADDAALVALGYENAGTFLQQLQSQYQLDSQNYYNSVLTKLQYSDAFYNSILTNNTQFVNKFLSDYGIDLKNYSSYAQAKAAIEMKLLSQVSSEWSKYYNAQLNTFNAGSALKGGMSQGDIDKVNKYTKAKNN